MDEIWTERRSGVRRHESEARRDFEIDYARVVHSGSFRRLQGKTQILSLGDDDFYRTRLTHSLEVAQVAEGILQHLLLTEGEAVAGILPDGSLVRTLGLAHDIGHPPFGHGGELALNYCMRASGGFEGNAQTLRILGRLEPYSDSFGADLTRRTLLGLLKYPTLQSTARNPDVQPQLVEGTTVIGMLDYRSCKPAKACFDCDSDVIDWVLEPLSQADRDQFAKVVARDAAHAATKHKSLDCTLMDAADDIAYGVHDFEDALALKLIAEGDFRAGVPESLCGELIASLRTRPIAGVEPIYEGLVAGLFQSARQRKSLIGRLVHYLIRSSSVIYSDGFEEPLLSHRVRLGDEPRSLLDALQSLIVERVIRSPNVQHLEFKGQRTVVATFEALMSDPKGLLPEQLYTSYRDAGNDPRFVCDYLASLTDAGLLRLYERLFSPRVGTIFDRF